MFVIKTSFKLNFLKTLYFNFKVLTFRQALKLPIHFYGKTDFANLSGKFKITSEIHFGMIIFGGHEVVISSNVATRIYNSGTIEFNGNAMFARGVNIMVWDNGNLTIGKNFSIGSLSRIIAFRNIRFGHDVLISWECQFFDTDFHFIQSADMKIKDNCAEVIIGDGVWFGTRSTVLKGTKLLKNVIVAANCVCSGDYSKHGESVLFAGVPAKYIKSDVTYLKDKKEELELFRHFSQNQYTEVIWKP